MSDETMRTPWRQDESGNVLDASGKKVVLTGVAVACGYITDGDPCRAATTEMIRAVNEYEPMRALLQKCATALDGALVAYCSSCGFTHRTRLGSCPNCGSDARRTGIAGGAVRTLLPLLAECRAAGVEPTPEAGAQK